MDMKLLEIKCDEQSMLEVSDGDAYGVEEPLKNV